MDARSVALQIAAVDPPMKTTEFSTLPRYLINLRFFFAIPPAKSSVAVSPVGGMMPLPTSP